MAIRRSGHEVHEHHQCANVVFHVNNKEVYAHPGRYPIATIKKLAGVPLADDLDELVECTLKPLPDAESVTIRGSEIFVSHPKDGGSS